MFTRIVTGFLLALASLIVACGGSPAAVGMSPVAADPTARPHEPAPATSRPPAADDPALAEAIARFQDFAIAQAAYQGDQDRWRSESDSARAKASTRAAMGLRVPSVRPPDPRLAVALDQARQAFEAEYARLDAEARQRCDAHILAFVEGQRARPGPRRR